MALPLRVDSSKGYGTGVLNPVESPSLLEDRIIEVLGRERFRREPGLQSALRYTLYALGVLASATSCVMLVEIALDYHQDSGHISVLGGAGVAGALINFGLFGAWGYILLARQVMEGIDPEARSLFKSNASRIALASQIFLSVIWGSVGRFPSAGAVIQFNHNVPWAVATLLGGAGPNIWSCFKLISGFHRRIFDVRDVKEKQLEEMRKELLSSFSGAKQMMLGMSPTERGEFAEVFYYQETDIESSHEKIAGVFSKVKELSRAHATQVLENRGAECFLKMANIVMLVPATLVLAQSLLLANTAAQTYVDDPILTWGVAGLATTADVWITYHLHHVVTNYVFNKIRSFCSGNVRERTFTEAVYPRLQLLLDLLALSIALTPFAQLISIAQRSAEQDLHFGGLAGEVVTETYVYGSYIGWTVMLFKAVQDLIVESNLRALSKSRFAGEDARHAALILEKLEKVELLIEKTNPEHLRKFLDNQPIGDLV